MLALLANWKRILYGTALVLLGTLLLVQTARIDGFLFWDGLKAENEKLTGQLVSMEQAQELARKAQLALNKSISDKQTEIARLTDENQTNRLKLADAANRYASGNSLRKVCPSIAGNNSAAESGVAQSGNSADPDAVILSRSDFDILNGNTARLMDVKAWGDRMIAEGLAERK